MSIKGQLGNFQRSPLHNAFLYSCVQSQHHRWRRAVLKSHPGTAATPAPRVVSSSTRKRHLTRLLVPYVELKIHYFRPFPDVQD